MFVYVYYTHFRFILRVRDFLAENFEKKIILFVCMLTAWLVRGNEAGMEWVPKFLNT